MKKYIICIIIAITAGLNAKVSAQGLNSGYFTDGYTFAHQLNPAFDNDHNYFSIPVLGNINIGTRGNVGLGSFLFPYKNGQLTTFMNSSVSAEEFLGGLKDNNRIGASTSPSSLPVSRPGAASTPLTSACVPTPMPICLTNCSSS